MAAGKSCRARSFDGQVRRRKPFPVQVQSPPYVRVKDSDWMSGHGSNDTTRQQRASACLTPSESMTKTVIVEKLYR